MDRLRQKEEDQRRRSSCDSSLHPKDVTPRLVRDNDSSKERTKGRADQRARQEPRKGSGTLRRTVDVAYTSRADDQETRALESSKDAEDEEGSQVRRECGADGEGREEEGGEELGPAAAVGLAHGTPEHGGETHEELVQGIG